MSCERGRNSVRKFGQWYARACYGSALAAEEEEVEEVEEGGRETNGMAFDTIMYTKAHI